MSCSIERASKSLDTLESPLCRHLLFRPQELIEKGVDLLFEDFSDQRNPLFPLNY